MLDLAMDAVPRWIVWKEINLTQIKLRHLLLLDVQGRLTGEFTKNPRFLGNNAAQHEACQGTEMGRIFLDVLRGTNISVADYGQSGVSRNPGEFVPTRAPLEFFRRETRMHGDGMYIMILEKLKTVLELFPPSFRVISQATLYGESSSVAGPDPL